MKKTGLIPFILLLTACLMAGNPGLKSVLKILHSNQETLELHYQIKTWDTEPITTVYGNFTKLNVDGYLWKTEPGKPALPMLRRIITLPVGASVVPEIEINHSSYILLPEQGITAPIFPTQPEYAKTEPKGGIGVKESIQPKPFQFDRVFYSTSQRAGGLKGYRPISSDLIRITDLGIMRNVRLMAIDFFPFIYEPVLQELLLMDDVNLTLRLTGSDLPRQNELNAMYHSPAYESVLQKFVINYEAFAERNFLIRTPLRYLILTPPNFLQSLEPFILWKRQEGYRVVVKTVGAGADIENNSTAIKNWLQQSWNNATAEEPAFSFVLIVGDTPQITWSATYQYQSSGVWYQTDRNFFLLQGSDSIPDMYWGRFSASSIAQLETIIAKTIQYQKMNMPNQDYLANACLIAGPDYDQGIPQNTPITNNQVLYATTYFNSGNGFNTATWYSPSSHYATSEIVSRINQGNSIVSYTGHGLENRWDGPVVSSAGSNLNKYGIVIANACLTSTINSTTSYGESWVRSSSGGAVAYIGASCFSIWTPDFYWSVGTHGMTYSPGGDGVYDALFHNQGQNHSQWAGSVGAMVFIGNMAVVAGASDWSSYYWAVYNVVGDPSTIPYMGVPSASTAAVPEYLISSPDMQLEVTSAQSYSYVSAYRNGTTLAGYANINGTAVLNLSAFSQPGNIDLVISCPGVQPVISSLNVLAPIANPTLTAYSVHGSSNNQLNPNQTFGLDLQLLNLGGLATGSLNLNITSGDPYLNIISSNATVSALEVNQSEILQNLFSLEVLAHAPNNHLITFNLEIEGYGTNSLSFLVIRPPSQQWIALEEDFECGNTPGTPPAGWLQQQISGSNQWLLSGTEGYLGGNCIKLQGIASAWIYRSVELTAGRPYKLRFRYKTTTSTSTNYRIHFAVASVPPTSSTTWGSELYNANVANSAWQLYNGTATYTPGSTGTYFFGFRGNLINHNTNFMYADNIELLFEEDLSVQTITIGPDDVIAGEPLTVSASIRNNSIPVTNKEVQLLVGGVPTETFIIASLATNASININFNHISLAGQITYQVSVAPDSNPTNNQQSASFFSFPDNYAVQSFESALNPPSGWNFQPTWSVKNTAVNRYHENNYAVMDNAGVTQTDRRISTAILFRQSSDKLRFYYKTYNNPNTRLQYSMDGNSWITLRQLPNTSQVWTRHELNASELPAPHTGIWYIAICSSTGTGTHYTFLDKFIYEAGNTATPVLYVNPSSLDFGNVAMGEYAALQSITIKNIGGNELILSGLSLAEESQSFSFQSLGIPSSLFSQDSLTVNIDFFAQLHGANIDTLFVQTNAGIAEIVLYAYAWQEPIIASWHSEFNFEQTPLGQCSTHDFVFYNSGDGFLTLEEGDIQLSTNNQIPVSAFQIIDTNTYPVHLSYMQQIAVAVQFCPLEAIEYSHGLAVSHNGTILLTIPISGMGIQTEIAVPATFIQRTAQGLFLCWHPVDGANSYRVMHSYLPDDGFNEVQNPDYFLVDGIYSMFIGEDNRGFFIVIGLSN